MAASTRLDVKPYEAREDRTAHIAMAYRDNLPGLQRYWRAKVIATLRLPDLRAQETLFIAYCCQRDDVHDILMDEYDIEPYDDEPIPQIDRGNPQRSDLASIRDRALAETFGVKTGDDSTANGTTFRLWIIGHHSMGTPHLRNFAVSIKKYGLGTTRCWWQIYMPPTKRLDHKSEHVEHIRTAAGLFYRVYLQSLTGM